MDRTLIDRTGAFYLILLMLLAKLFTPEPRMLAMKVGTSAWLVNLLAGLVAMVGYWFLATLLRRFPRQSLAAISRRVLGTPIGGVFTLVYVGYFLYLASLSLREFVTGFRLAIMPQTPPSALTMLCVLAMAFVAGKGMETIARMAAYLTPFLLVLFGLTIIGSIRVLEWTAIFPIMGNGTGLTLFMSLPESSLYSEIIILGTLAGMLPSSEATKAGLRAMIGGTLGQTVAWVVFTMSLPYPMTSRFAFPMLEVVRLVEFGEVLQRLEAFFVLLWFFVAALKLSLLLTCSAMLLMEMLRLEDYRPLIPGLAVLIYTISFIPPNEISLVWLDSYTLRIWSWPVSFGLPAITLAVAVLRGKRGATGGHTAETAG